MKKRLLMFTLIFAMLLPSFIVGASAASIVYGDATGDGIVDGKDLVRLKKYLAAYDYETGTSDVAIEPSADATGDGAVDGKDLVRLKKYIAAYDYETGTSTVPLGPEGGAVTPAITDYVYFERADMLKLDSNGNLIVKATVESEKAEKEISISSIDGKAVGFEMKTWARANGYDINALTNADLQTVLLESGMNSALDIPLYNSTLNPDGTHTLVPVRLANGGIYNGVYIKDGIVVATENQAFDYSKLASKDEVIVFAENDPATAGDDEYINVRASELLLEGETADDILGYSLKMCTVDNWDNAICVRRCDSDILYNYGNEKNEIRYVQMGYAPNITARTNMIKLGGKNYSWNGGLSSFPDFVAYAMTPMTSSTKAPMIHYYDTDGNIVDPGTGKILLYLIDGKYYVEVQTTGIPLLRAATSTEIADAKFADENLSYTVYNCYKKISECSDLWDNKFCELKVFDPDNDGDWDYGIFKPYSVGTYGTGVSAGERYVSDFALDRTSSTRGKELLTIDNNNVFSYAGRTSCPATLLDAVKFVGDKPAAGDKMIYSYNYYTGVFEVIENLGVSKIGRITELTGIGSYAVIDGVKYAYNLAESNLLGFDASDVSFNALVRAIENRTFKIGYFAAGGYLLETRYVEAEPDIPEPIPQTYNRFAAFSMADLVRIDDDNNLIVNAVIDYTGVKKEIKISGIDNYKIGLRLAAELETFGYATPIYTNSDLVKAYAGAVAGINESPMPDLLSDTVFARKVNSDGTCSLVSLDHDYSELEVVDGKNPTVITYDHATTDSAFTLDGKPHTATEKTVFVFAGKDDVLAYMGIPYDGSKIDLSGANTVLVRASDNFVFVYDETKSAQELYFGFNNCGEPVYESREAFYAIVKNTTVSLMATNKPGIMVLTVKNLYNVLTDDLDDVIVSADIETLMPIYNAINSKWQFANTSTNCANLIYYSESEGIFEVLPDYTKFEEYFREHFSNYSTLYTMADLGKITADPYTLVINGSKIIVLSYNIRTFWGYEGTVETLNGSAAHNLAVAPNSDVAFVAIDDCGNAYGYCFAYGMSSTRK